MEDSIGDGRKGHWTYRDISTKFVEIMNRVEKSKTSDDPKHHSVKDGLQVSHKYVTGDYTDISEWKKGKKVNEWTKEECDKLELIQHRW